MSMELFEKICRDYHDIGGGALSVNSMHADMFFDPMLFERIHILEQYRENLYLYATTNLLGTAKLDDAQLEHILGLYSLLQVSLGGVTRETYKEMYGVDAFDIVLAQLNRIAKLRERGNITTDVHLNFRVADKNKLLADPLYRDISSRFTVDEVRDSFFSWGGLLTQKDLPEGCALVTRDNVDKREDCVVPWASLCVNPQGKAIGCGCIDYQGAVQIGDLSTESILEVWNSHKARQFREGFSSISSRNIHSLCRDCYLYMPLSRAFSRKELRDYRPRDGLYYYQ